MFRKIFFHEVERAAEVFEQLIEPVCAVGVGGFGGKTAKKVRAEEGVAEKVFFEFFSQARVRDDDIGIRESCQVEGLAGRGADDRVLGEVLGECTE